MDVLTEHLRKLGSKGGTARAKNLSKPERQESARRAAHARWSKQKKAAK